MADFDTISKYLVQTYPGDFARFTLGRNDVEVMDLLDNEQPTPLTPRTDSTLRVRIDGEEVLVHTEFRPPTAPMSPCRGAWQAISDAPLNAMACRFFPAFSTCAPMPAGGTRGTICRNVPATGS